MIFRNRGYLPHLEDKGAMYFVTFRLAGTLPAEILANWKFEREDIEQEARRQGRELSEYERQRLSDLYSTRIEDYYDRVIRSDEEFGRSVQYTLQNPVKAGL